MVGVDIDACIWRKVFNMSEVYGKTRASYSAVNSTGILTVALGLWISSTIVMKRLFSVGSYRNLANYTLAAALRRSVPSFTHAIPVFHVVYKWRNYTFVSCEFFAFWETFFAVFEIESLTLVCVERYVQAKYTSKGWRMNPSFYFMYGSIALFFAVAYAIPPVIGIGSYDKDFDCFHCTFDMVLPQDWTRYLIALIFFLRSIKPFMVMVPSLYWAKELERQVSPMQKNLTKGVTMLVMLTSILCLPLVYVRGTVIISQLLFDTISVPFSIYLPMWSMVLHWFAPTVGMIGLVCCDPILRDFMIRYFCTIEDTPEEPEEPQPAQPIKRD